MTEDPTPRRPLFRRAILRARNVSHVGRGARPVGQIALLPVFLLIASLSVGAVRDVHPANAGPALGDHTALSWREGAPYFTSARYAAERRFLRVETGRFSADFDTEQIAVVGFLAHATPRNEASATAAALEGALLPAAKLTLGVRVADTLFICRGRNPLTLDSHGHPARPLEFPVRVIESGRYFQKFALHDLDFRCAAGARLAASAWLEISIWPDRLSLTLVVRPEQTLTAADALLRLETGGGNDASRIEAPATWAAGHEHRATLTLSSEATALAPTEPADAAIRVIGAAPVRATVRWSAEELCHVVRLESPEWPTPTEGHYPMAMLDAWESTAVEIENRSSAPLRLPLLFEHAPPKSLTGFVPLLLDAAGWPLGFPVQISKNWHQVGPEAALPHAGPWMHGRAWLHVPAQSRVALRYGVTFARWGGLPTASLAQLSLVGWGHNGFWEQFALGAFGESLCFQPGRAMRRALLADLRPLLQRGFAQDERWAWPANVGGGDILVRYDARGRYVPFKRNVTRHVSPGPNLAHLVHEEIAADEAIRGRVEVFLPRTDDHVRVYLKIRYDALRRTPFSRLAFFELGAEHYNEADATALAWGDAARLGAEYTGASVRATPLAPWPAMGEAPWISLHGEKRDDTARTGQASRGLIVRAWQARLGGQSAPTPTFAATLTRPAKAHLGAAIVPPAGLTALEPGDYVEMLLELVALPLAAERYYGSNESFHAALAAHANTWRIVQREASRNRPMLRDASVAPAPTWPLTLAGPAEKQREISFTLEGGLGWVPVRLTGLRTPKGIELFRVNRAGRERVEQGDPARPFWQADFDPAKHTWSITYNLPAPDLPTRYVATLTSDEQVTPSSTPPPRVETRTTAESAP
jgi:hypothetical protein